MTAFDGASSRLFPASQADGSSERPIGAAFDAGAGLGRAYLGSILAFLNREIGQSGVMLHEFATLLSSELCALGQADSIDARRPHMLAATMALQNEDRVQQRLRDLRCALSLVEQALLLDDPDIGPDLDRAIIDQCHLEEIRVAFARSRGIPCVAASSPPAGSVPSIGDIDLF
jgi:hypothetical protein